MTNRAPGDAPATPAPTPSPAATSAGTIPASAVTAALAAAAAGTPPPKRPPTTPPTPVPPGVMDEAAGAPGSGGPKNRRRGFPWVRIDWPRLVYAVIIAVLLWSYIDYKRMGDKQVDIQVVIEMPKDWEDLGATRLSGRGPVRPGDGAGTAVVRRVYAELRGSNRLLDEVRSENLEIRIPLDLDASAADVVEQNVALSGLSVTGLPAGVAVQRLEPASIKISATRLVPYSIPVQLEVEGTPESGYVDRKYYQIVPREVEIRIPKTLRERIAPTDNILTQPFSLAGRRATASGRVELRPFEKDGYEAWPTPGAVYVTVNLEVEPGSRRFEDLPLQLMLSPLGRDFVSFNFNPSRVAVTLEGPPVVLERVDPRAVVVYVDSRDATDLGDGTFDLHCLAIPPSGCRVAKIEPAAVKWSRAR